MKSEGQARMTFQVSGMTVLVHPTVTVAPQHGGHSGPFPPASPLECLPSQEETLALQLVPHNACSTLPRARHGRCEAMVLLTLSLVMPKIPVQQKETPNSQQSIGMIHSEISRTCSHHLIQWLKIESRPPKHHEPHDLHQETIQQPRIVVGMQ